jgi:PAS domain S-box-containing protein
MNHFLPLKNPLIIIVAATGWAFVADPLISRLAQQLAPAHRDLFRSLNDFIVLMLVSLILYRRISRQAREVRKTRDDYRRLFEEVPVPMFIFDSRDFRFLAANTAAADQYGYSQAEFLQLKITDIRPLEEVPAFLAAVGEIPGRYADAGRWLHRKKNGDTFYVRIFSHHTVFEGVPAKQTLVIDIDQKIRTEKALEEKSAELESMTDAFYTVDRDWNFTYINAAYERVQGRNRDELVGKNVWELFPYGKELRYFREYDRALREQVSVHFEEFNTFNGMWVSASAYPIKSGLAVYFRDITRQKEHVEQIEKQNDKLRKIAWIQSHKLRLPVANILGLAELSRLDCTAKEDLIPKFCQEAERLDELIREITLLSENLS